MSELRENGDHVVHLGLIPKISIDARIRCPCRFTNEFQAPPPPTLGYSNIACRAARQILATMWPYRQYIEVIKVGYSLDKNSINDVNITGELIIVVPAIGEKITISSAKLIGSRYSTTKLGLDLFGPDEFGHEVIVSLSEDLERKSRQEVQLHTQEKAFQRVTEKLQKFQKDFTSALDLS
jgi:hypothetical protein